MGYAHYKIARGGQTIEAGYGVETVCEQDGCEEKIDRGLGYLCGAEPGGDEYGCGGYFCGHHLFGSSAPIANGLCASCSGKQEQQEMREPASAT